jgi:hypothetical protein
MLTAMTFPAAFLAIMLLPYASVAMSVAPVARVGVRRQGS